MKRKIIVVVLLGALMGIPFLVSQAGPATPVQGKKVPQLMKAKLENSQKVLEGITLNDFKKIEKHADELISISKATEWRSLKTVRFEMYSQQFRRIAIELRENAKKKNLDAAALNYVNLTLTCVNCHKHVREVRMASLDTPHLTPTE
jgi:predicted DNA-binding protein (UPF0251 family)